MTTTIDKDTEQLLSTVVDLESKVIVRSNKDQLFAATMLATVKKHQSNVEQRKAYLLDPLNETIKRIKEQFKSAEDKLNNMETQIKEAMLTYYQKQDTKATEKLEAINKDLEDGNITVDEAMVQISKVGQPDATVRVAEGAVQFRKSPERVRVINPMILPPSYFMRDSVMEALRKEIEKDRKNGLPVPDGVQIYRDTTVAGVK